MHPQLNFLNHTVAKCSFWPIFCSKKWLKSTFFHSKNGKNLLVLEYPPCSSKVCKGGVLFQVKDLWHHVTIAPLHLERDDVFLGCLSLTKYKVTKCMSK